MIFRNHRENRRSMISLGIYLWLFYLAYQGKQFPGGQFAEGQKIYFSPELSSELVNGLKKNVLLDSNPNDKYALETDASLVEGPLEIGFRFLESGNVCCFFEITKSLLCNGSINYNYLKEIPNQEITYFIVENYEAESLYRKSNWSSRSLKTGEWYTKIPRMHQKLSGKIQLKDSGLQINVNLRLLPLRDLQGFQINGEAFSNKVIKISWRLTGKLSLNFIDNRTVISLAVGTLEDTHWKLYGNLTFLKRNLENEADEWKTSGCIISDNVPENQIVFYKGAVWTRLKKEECMFLGKVKVQNVHLEVRVTGKVSPPQQRQITIPKSAFSNMTIRNIIFKDSKFFKDFDKNSFEGLRGLKSITFTESKLEMLPRLDELFQSFTELEEIYIEDCIAPNLKFGKLTTLRNVRKLSFKGKKIFVGSGPLNFDDNSFMWLSNSNLTYLSMRSSNVKISTKGYSALRGVSNTLKNLDISYSTVNGEKDFALILNNLSIISLMAEGLKLRKIPTIGLSYVRETLRFLSLRGNDFRKNMEKQIFDSILNFPIMINLIELNLEDCHINYIEKGIFDNLPYLKILHLAYNNLENIQDGWSYIRPQITYLSLRNNGLIPQISTLGLYELETTLDLSEFQKLEVLDLSNGIFTDIKKVISGLGSSLRNLSMQNSRLEDLPEKIFENMTGLETLDLSYNRNIKTGQSFSFNLFRNLKNLRSLNLKHCRISDVSIYQNDFFESNKSDYIILENLKSLDLSVNNLKRLDSKMLGAFPKLKILNLSGNSITEWSDIMLSTNMDTVFLDENKIETISSVMLSNIKKLKQVKLGNNPFICGPYVYEIMKIINAALEENRELLEGPNQVDSFSTNLRDLRETETDRNTLLKELFYKIRNKEGIRERKNDKIIDWSEKNYVCYSWSQTKFIPFNKVDENFQKFQYDKKESYEAALLSFGAIVVIGVVMTFTIICWKFLDIHLLTRAVRSAVALTFISREEKGPNEFKYNVFLSYCEKDRLWVFENLLPRLETKSDMKVCLHERDFQVGMSIIENILNCIDSSRNIILVLSQAFLKSQWCQYEMQLAQFRLMEKGRDHLLLIFLENIPAVRRPKALRYLMMTMTYLEWPVNPKSTKEVDVFWKRLMKSIIIKDC